MLRIVAAAFLLLAATPAWSETTWPNQQSGDGVLKDFRFASGEVLPELKLHYVTLGAPRRNPTGEIANAVLLLHGTGGTSQAWLRPTLADELFARGAPLDP